MTATDVLARIKALVTPGKAAEPEPSRGLQAPAQFFAALRGGLLGPTLSGTEVDGCAAILAACEGWPIAWTAYALATAYHETAATLQPVKEYGGSAYHERMYGIGGLRPAKARELGNLKPGEGAKYAGRGYVQLSGKANYAKASQVVGRDLVAEPDLAMHAPIAAAILRSGMGSGWFTGKRLADYLDGRPATHAQFRQARRIINGLDRADDIAGYALAFQDALTRGLWT